ncbi:proline-rich protein HaeIII subfamily 1-like [Ornithodoros turicata]|uniref:proline-rich protein HaeIII subfamily 1-like n=1 Tax=Ornithodoros turicata TaxID=34597 RepID=UPI00313A067D
MSNPQPARRTPSNASNPSYRAPQQQAPQPSVPGAPAPGGYAVPPPGAPAPGGYAVPPPGAPVPGGYAMPPPGAPVPGGYAMQGGYPMPPPVAPAPFYPMGGMPGSGMPDTGRAWVDPQNPNTLYYEGFDAGARFTPNNPPSIPPPPPGVAPNPAQMAQMQGQNVVVTQRQAGLLEGPPGGGVDTSCSIS